MEWAKNKFTPQKCNLNFLVYIGSVVTLYRII